MKTGEYWQDRAGQIAARLHRDADAYNKALRREYDIALKTIERDMEVFFERYAEDNLVSMADARKLLSGGELKEYRMTLEEFITKAKDNADGRWTQQLNNAYYRTRISRYEALQMQARQQVEMLAASRQGGTGKLLENTYKEAYYRNLYEIQKGTGVGFSFARLDDKRLQKVLGTEWAEGNWSKRIWGDRNKLGRELETKIAQSLIRGDSLDRMTQDVAERMQVSYSSAHRLVQTETAYFTEQATMDSYNEAGVQHFEFLATLDERTCPVCGPLDGKVFKVSEQIAGINCGPLHPRCRCTTVPYFDDDEIDYGERIAKDREGSVVSVPGNMTYSQWKMKFVA